MSCQICGKYSSYFKLCKKCYSLLEQGIIKSCDECGAYYVASERCPICNTKNTNSKDEDGVYCTDSDSCILCGEPSNGKHFCYSCYSKYKDREIEVHIKNCTNFKITDKYCTAKLRCENGVKVRSRAEVIICNFLFYNNIRAIYEDDVYYMENGEEKLLHPDFYLPDYDLYIEYNELKNDAYIKRTQYKDKIYREKGLKVIKVTEKEIADLSTYLKSKLRIR